MKQSFVADLIPGSAVNTTFLVQAKERRTGRNGSAYLDLELQDATGRIRAKLWDCDVFSLDFDVQDFVLAEGEVEEYQGALQVRLRSISRCEEGSVDLLDYFPRSRRDLESLYLSLLERVRRMTEEPLRSLVLALMEDPPLAAKFKLAPAATTYHHAYLGGLLEHISSLVALADRVCDHYTSLDRDLLLAGLVLHDIGKIEELSFERGFRYSTRGQLIGHIAIGLDMVREKMRALGFPPELRDKLEHIILAHHGKLEFGSPKEPMFPEALVVHYLDDLDSKLESMRQQYEADRRVPGDWTTRNRALGRPLLKVSRDANSEDPGPDRAGERQMELLRL